jgi:hypothetical protein
VASLRRRHLQVSRAGIVTLHFERCKGGKSTHDTLDEVVSTVLLLWVQTAYQSKLSEIDSEAAIWMDLAHPSRAHVPLGYQGIAGVCRHYLDTSKVHTTRHSFALLMQAMGAKLTERQQATAPQQRRDHRPLSGDDHPQRESVHRETHRALGGERDDDQGPHGWK